MIDAPVEAYDFALPPASIAQEPARPRDAARLLAPFLDPPDRVVRDLPELLRPGDLLVVNDTRVIPARLDAVRRRGGARARIGVTLDQPEAADAEGACWRALVRNARRLAEGETLEFDGTDLSARVARLEPGGVAILRFDRGGEAFARALAEAGRLALPPYIRRAHGPTEADRSDYQTCFAAEAGAVAAPTAGLHFTPALLEALARRGIGRTAVTLHVGAGTFLPMRAEAVDAHRIHSERGAVPEAAVAAIEAARAGGGRIVAVGTTSLRILEAAAIATGRLAPFDGRTDLFIRPGHRFRSADLLLTNFHLPRSTLFMLVCAFAGTARMHACYRHAIEAGYRFYSYGDASLLAREAGHG